MTDHERLIAIKIWCAFMIKNQEQLKEEWSGPIMPDWNKGYFECLEDLQAILEDEE